MRTKDLGLVVALKTLGYKELEIDQSNPREIYFEFEEDKDILRLTSEYYNEELMVSAQKYFQKYRSLKSKLYEIRDKDENKGYLYR